MTVNLAGFVIVKILTLSIFFANAEGVYYLNDGQTVLYDPKTFVEVPKEKLQIYCYNGKAKSILNFFETVKLSIVVEDDKKYTQYEGANIEEVLGRYEENMSLFNFNWFSRNRPRLSLSPFGNYCLGVAADEAYKVNLKVYQVDRWRLALFLVGVLFFFKARLLSNNIIFFYIAGVILGVFASSLLALYVASKFVPKPPMMYGLLIGGWTLTAYLIKFIFDNVQMLFNSYTNYIIWYVVIVSIASFLYVYRIGPPTNPRTKNILKWLLELLSLIVIYFSSHYETASIYVCLAMLAIRYFPYAIYEKIHKIYRLRNPLPRRLLTMKEYERQGIEETNKSLSSLRAYVNSPNCSQWRVISSLRNPSSFADFANGGNHVTYDELNRFQQTITDSSDDDDDDYDDTESNEVLDNENIEWNNPDSSNDQMNAYVDYDESDDAMDDRG